MIKKYQSNITPAWENMYFKNKLILLFICGLISGFIIPVDEINDLEKYRLKGSVKSVMEIKYSLAGKDAGGQKDKIMYQKFILFDRFGYEAETKLFKNGDIFLSSVYLFGNDGKQVEMNEYHPDGTLNLNVTYVYNDKGFLSEANYIWAENRIIGEICENTDYYYEIIQNDLFSRVVYINEYRGYCVEEHYVKADSSLSFKFVAKYDIHGNKLESGYFHGNGRLSWMTKYQYDRYNNLIESRVFKSNRIAVLSEYDYQFDSYGNWVVRKEKRKVYVNILTEGLERANTITERTIEYY
jgi:hypothetical protein